MSVEYFGSHIAALTAVARYHARGFVCVLDSRTRSGVTLYRVRCEVEHAA